MVNMCYDTWRWLYTSIYISLSVDKSINQFLMLLYLYYSPKIANSFSIIFYIFFNQLQSSSSFFVANTTSLSSCILVIWQCQLRFGSKSFADWHQTNDEQKHHKVAAAPGNNIVCLYDPHLYRNLQKVMERIHRSYIQNTKETINQINPIQSQTVADRRYVEIKVLLNFITFTSYTLSPKLL